MGSAAAMRERIEAFIRSHNMFAPGARVGIAVSGGADSRCLLDILFKLRSNWNLSLTLLHVNHCLRGEESDADEDFVRALASEYGLPIEIERADVSGAPDNLEQAARDARRRFFRRFLDSGSLDRVALAHTRSDQAETVLLRFLRGSHTTGLCAMWPVTPDGFVRPLLSIDRDEVQLYLHELNLSWREDSSNSEIRFARNRIRHELLPKLTLDWNPQLPVLLAQYATLAQEDEEFWEQVVTQNIALERHAGGFVLKTEVADAPPALSRRIIRRVIEMVRGDLRQIDFRHVHQVLDLMRGSEGHARIQIPGVDVLRSFDRVRFAKPATAPVERDFSLPFVPPATIPLPGGEVELCFEIVDSVRNEAVIDPARGKLEAELDWQRIQSGPLELRNWRPGDSYRCVGQDQEQKIKLMFQEHRIPLWERRNWPILCVDDEIVWSRRFGSASGFAAEPHAPAILRIFEKKQPHP
jgi:tRNA(Ile)-lysidine synthase